MPKAKKRSKRKSSKKISSRTISVKQVSRETNWTFFLNALFFVLFVYAGWLLWTKPWTQGLSLIVLLLIIILIGRLIRKR